MDKFNTTSSAKYRQENTEATQRIVKIRRDYNTWVANETIEDFALRFTPASFRKWSIFRVSNTALGAISFLVLEAIGGTIAVNYGFVNAFWAILAVSFIIFTTGIPISYYAAKYGVDMDLLTRGAGFGYIGSTISSFIYASFTFILFALEAAIMAYALELALDIPLYIGYMISALIVVPLVTHGVTLISRIQMITQPLWLILMLLPFVAVFIQEPDVLSKLIAFQGEAEQPGFNLILFGAATAAGIALVTQIGEQVDYLRFMPKMTEQNKFKWHLGVLVAGPGWVLVGVFKMLAGALLAYLAISSAIPTEDAVNPTHMYLLGFERVFASPQIAMAATAIFVIISQIKINMTNAYAGSLAWSNFFARLTHSHPGRVIWAVFNALIAVLLMEMDVFRALEQVLGLYSNIAISWITAVVADLVINKPLGLSPKGIEFRRAYLYDINPVGVGAMLIASIVSISAFMGLFGESVKAFSAFIALSTALFTSPLIAWYTKGRYYIARKPYQFPQQQRMVKCSVCERDYEAEDMSHCPAYQGFICSLCCCLDARCNDVCKPDAVFSKQWESWLKQILPQTFWPYLQGGLSAYLLMMATTLLFLAALLGLVYYHQRVSLPFEAANTLALLKSGYIKIFAFLALASAIVAWWLVLNGQSRRVAQEESNRQTGLLLREIELHKETDAELQLARLVAEQANQAKSRYITGISHELRTPLNSILGYAQLLDSDMSFPKNRKPAIQVIRRSGEHLLSLIESTLDIARIEGGKLVLDTKPLQFPEFINQIVNMFELQVKNKGLSFDYQVNGDLPKWVRADQKRLMQILVNILGNALKFTNEGYIAFRIHYAREIAYIEIEDTGPGIPEAEQEKIFEPFIRGSAANQVNVGGTGLGLTISKLLTDLMGGEMLMKSEVGKGTIFNIRLFLPQIHHTAKSGTKRKINRIGYQGKPRTILVVDNEQVDRELIKNILAPLNFNVAEAATGKECIDTYQTIQPDAILMDLAMPVMNGWEATYIIRKIHQSPIPIAIVSANAFDKQLENNADISSTDFIVKPVNVEDLLDWIGTHLALEWVESQEEPVKPEPANALTKVQMDYPRREIDVLIGLVDIGYIKGIHHKLDAIVNDNEAYADFVNTLRTYLNGYQLTEMKRYLQKLSTV